MIQPLRLRAPQAILCAMLCLLAVGLCGGSVHADTVTLKDGTVREGKIVKKDEHGVTLEIRLGAMKGTVVIPHAQIASVEKKALPASPVESEAQKLRAAADQLTGAAAAEAWVRLGDYLLNKNGYSPQAREAYRKALSFDGDHATARGRLGHVKTEAGWQAVEDERRARGLVPLGDGWLKPGERAMVIDRRHAEETDELRIGPRREMTFTEEQIERRLAEIDRDPRMPAPPRLREGESLLSRYGYYDFGDGFFIGTGYAPYYADGVGIVYGDSSAFFGRIGYGLGDDYYGRSLYGRGGRGHRGTAHDNAKKPGAPLYPTGQPSYPGLYKKYGYYPGYEIINGKLVSKSYSDNGAGSAKPNALAPLGSSGPYAWYGRSGSPYYGGRTTGVTQQFRRNYGYSPGVVYRNGNKSFAFGTNFGGGYGGYGIQYSSNGGKFRYSYGGNGYSSGSNLHWHGGSKNFRYNINVGGFSGGGFGGWGF